MVKAAFFAVLLLIAGVGSPTDAKATSEELSIQPADRSGLTNTTLKESVPWPSWMRTYV
ncbi:hypothetical protein F441_12778 [Phytophthora nicotianae CJ01A1]|uniref:RxLR effector protein n=6 Tax=Phytophthora nicotianae TaxID=4792 RepID=W2PXN9_PHYN3|nr:hypothetical protein PPTG_23484 [Phytophthora nicotianae INRA-310]ETI42006.1 hypothetical protein F443_12819 [Phytophthora nicotianae P1569]ETK82020.1 hypothetical protein L915_12534 [Phytophthora nicotianae]ETO70614.1 hypothetical protein F444_12929 [Phytophthora nicotianae P1976]ETP11768.1 hypothetical protein F441_12778 [Phytophthora nicotianae CJ01A1]ETP39859.1 hypothetical protein F442_12730 [Phytophthora nicotianae P10297]